MWFFFVFLLTTDGREAKLSGTDRTQPLSSTDDDSEYLLAEKKKKN